MTDETDTTSAVARVLYRAGAWCGVCEYGGWNTCADCRATLTGYATALAEAGLLRDQATIDALNERCRILVDEVDAARAQIATQEPAEQPRATSGGVGTSGTLSDRLRALGTGQTRSLRKVLRAIAFEVALTEQARDLHRADANSLLQQKDQWKDAANAAEAQVERVLALAQRFRDQGQTGIARLVEEAVQG